MAKLSSRFQVKLLGFVTVLAVSMGFLALALQSKTTFLTELESRTWDWRIQLTARKDTARQDIKLILVDQSSLDFFEKEYSLTWPIPRDAYRYVIDFLTAGKAKGLAFDILFTESSAQAVETDRMFAEATSGTLPVVSAVTLESRKGMLNQEKLETFRKRQTVAFTKDLFLSHQSFLQSLPEYPGITLPIPELLEKSTAFGSVQAIPDSDGVYRHTFPAARVDGISVLSLPFAFYNLVQPSSESFSLEKFTDEQGRLSILPHGGSGTYPTFSLADIIQAQAARNEGKPSLIQPEIFKDCWVILGVSAPGLLDLRPTSLEPRANGVEFVAAVLDNLLTQTFGRHFSFPFIFGTTSLFCALIVLTMLAATSLRSQIPFLGLLFATFLFATYAAATHGVWTPFVVPLSGMIFTLLLSALLQYQLEGKERRFIRSAFQFYVSPSVVNEIVANPENLTLGGEKKELTIFFSDIEKFTTLSEKLDPTLLVQLLNEYLSLVADIIQNSGGTVDKYIGDGVVAFWNAPLSVNNHALRGVQAAVEIQQALLREAPHFREKYGVSLRTRIGLNTDVVSVGNFGSKTRFNYTIIGDGANLASRLEGVNRVFGTTIILSESTFAALPQEPLGTKAPLRRLGSVRVVGRAQPIAIYQAIPDDLNTPEALKKLEIFENGLRAFEKKEFETALELFHSIPDDPPAQAYLKRISLERSHVETDWTPVWNLSEK